MHLRTKTRFIIAVAVCAIAAPSSPSAKTWLVTPGGTGDAPTIQAGIDSAAAGDTVLLAPGTYTGDGNRDMDFIGKAIVVTSSGGAAVTTIELESQFTGFRFTEGETSASVLSGVTIQNASTSKSGPCIVCSQSSPTITNNRLIGNATGGGGGALFCIDFASPIVTNNLFQSNSAAAGGAMWCGLGSSPIVENNVFAGNTASSGGAIFCVSFAAPMIRNNTFSGNSAGLGGAIYLRDSSPVIENNIIAFSTAGEAVTCVLASAPTFICNDVFGNAGGDALCGTDAVDNFSSDPLFCGLPATGNYFLQSISPCAPANSPCGSRVGALPVMCGATAVREGTWGRFKALYESSR